MKFKEYLEESKLKSEFTINIGSDEYKVIRDPHVKATRGNTPMPRDASMSANKYQKILSQGLDHIDKTKSFTLTWTNTNNKNNAISGIINDNNEIIIFGAIMKSKSKAESLYKKKGTNRYHLGQIDFS